MKEKTYINSVKRAFFILEIFSKNNKEMGIRELSEKANLSKSTVHRFVNTLEMEGLLLKNPDNHKYRLSFKLFQLGQNALLQNDLRFIVKPILEKIVVELEQSAVLGVSENGMVVYIDKIMHSDNFQFPVQICSIAPLHCTASGKAILANLPDEERMELYELMELTSYTNNTITDYHELEKELQKVKTMGFAIDNEERFKGIVCIAAPFRDYTGKIAGAIGLPAFVHYLKYEELLLKGKELLKYVEEISDKLGYDPLNKSNIEGYNMFKY